MPSCGLETETCSSGRRGPALGRAEVPYVSPSNRRMCIAVVRWLYFRPAMVDCVARSGSMMVAVRRRIEQSRDRVPHELTPLLCVAVRPADNLRVIAELEPV